MKNINKIFSVVFVAILTVVTFTSCEDEEKARFPQLSNGGFVKFVTQPELNIGADPSSAAFVGMTEDPNNNVATYSVRVLGNFTGAPTDTLAFRSTTTFPFDVGFTTGDMAALFGVDASVFAEDDTFEFFGTVTTVDGVVYSGALTGGTFPGELDPNDAGSWNGGNSNVPLTSAIGLLNAFNWETVYEDPEPEE